MKINVISESGFFNLKEKFGGIHSAFINHVALLKKEKQEVVINSLGRADIVHLHSYGPFALFKLLSSKEPTVVMTHDVPKTFVDSVKGARLLMPLITAYFRFFYNHADLVMALNPFTKRELEGIGVKSKIIVLSNPVNGALFHNDENLRIKTREKYKILKNDFIVFGIGKQIPRKGIGDFLQIAKKFPDFKFFWVGGKDVEALSAQTPEQKDLIENPPQNVTLVGSVKYEETVAFYNMADVFLFPSYHEIASMVIIEAAACGLPLIIRDLPEYRELYQTGYIACKDNEDFGLELEKMYKNKKHYNDQVLGSKELADKFNGDIIGDKMIEYYHNLLRK